MKVRIGFVSNSSSSSFVCDTCREQYSGWDADPHDFDHSRCVMGHIFCNELLVDKKRFYEACKRFEENWSENYKNLPKDWYEDKDRIEKYGLSDDDKYEVPTEFCPICSMSMICDDDCIKYLYKKYSTNNKELAKEISEKFSTYKEFCDYLKEQ